VVLQCHTAWPTDVSKGRPDGQLHNVLKEEVMAVRPALLLVLVCGAGFTGSIIQSADAAAFICPDTVTSDTPKNTSTLGDLSSGTINLTAGNRVGKLVADHWAQGQLM
jgi:hypothetical protein